ncbi:DUF2752 domain-containing protein [Streptomyces boninensis]|uniref:DUF2752 domain-containing protein n=1 Tax=Streptomyces boninensis TaxID=2039455 RepID=UPI003B21F4AB
MSSAAPTTARRLAAPAAALTGVLAAFAYVGAVDPNESGHYPACPVLAFTGVYCPGCGGLRSAHAFAHGDLATAVSSNVLAVAAFAFAAYVLTTWFVRAARGRPLQLPFNRIGGWSVVAVLAVFMVVRNLPFGAALAP